MVVAVAPCARPVAGIERIRNSVAIKSVSSSRESAMPVMPFKQKSFLEIPAKGPEKMHGAPTGMPPYVGVPWLSST